MWLPAGRYRQTTTELHPHVIRADGRVLALRKRVAITTREPGALHMATTENASRVPGGCR